ncbi:MAG: hypothetical protein ABGY24_09930, partial [bacterium]
DILDSGSLMAPVEALPDVACHVAAGLAERAYRMGLATELPKPHNLLEHAYQSVYTPNYKKYR